MRNTYLPRALASLVAGQKRPKVFWNIFLCFAAAFFLSMLVATIYFNVDDYNTRFVKQTFQKIDEEQFICAEATYEIPNSSYGDKQKVNNFLNEVNSGDVIFVEVSNVSGKMKSVQINGKEVYQNVGGIFAYIFMYIACIAFVGMYIFSLVIINKKNLPKKLRKLRNEIMITGG